MPGFWPLCACCIVKKSFFFLLVHIQLQYITAQSRSGPGSPLKQIRVGPEIKVWLFGSSTVAWCLIVAVGPSISKALVACVPLLGVVHFLELETHGPHRRLAKLQLCLAAVSFLHFSPPLRLLLILRLSGRSASSCP